MKRKLHAPDSAPLAREGKDAIPKNPYTKSTKPFNAWAEKLVSDVDGWPSVPSAASAREGNSKKRAAEDGSEEREIFYDGVKFTARRTGGKSGSIELVDEDKIGKGEGQWPTGKVLRFTISKKDGATDGDKEDGERFDFGALKQRLEPIARPGFVSLVDERPIAGLPGGDKDMKDAPAEKSEFPTRLTAPPTIATASEAKKEDEPEAPAKGRGEQQYPAKGQASFKDVLSDEQFAKLKSEVAEVEGRKIEWVRVSGASFIAFLCLSLLPADTARTTLQRPMSVRTSSRARAIMHSRRSSPATAALAAVAAVVVAAVDVVGAVAAVATVVATSASAATRRCAVGRGASGKRRPPGRWAPGPPSHHTYGSSRFSVHFTQAIGNPIWSEHAEAKPLGPKTLTPRC